LRWHRTSPGDTIAIVLPAHDSFQRSIRQQIAENAARTPTERMAALCELLDAARALAPDDEQARQRRLRALKARQREREQWRAEFRRLFAAERANASTGL
jgi:hypothetical protein